MNAKVLRAVFKRNFVSYFANPTGYVFICVFVLLSTICAFWPPEFFNTNLANLNQLNRWFPFIMLVFIPAVTMAVWADERRQGTDELLLTIPAGDLDIVLGKYLAAVAIYTVALLFSLVCNFLILQFLGTPGPGPDRGLLFGTYVGYWLVGLAMLAIGMVASFLTSNLTIAYILGAVLNVPLVFAARADVVSTRQAAMAFKQWSIGEQFGDFGRGIVSLSGLVYFGMIVAVMLYLSIVLIGRRHWREAQGRLPNYVFYGLLHVGWFLSFASFWIVLKDYWDPANAFICLAALYLVLQAGLLWGWSQLARRTEAKPADAMVALFHLLVIVGFVILAPILDFYVDNPYVLTAALALYVVIHVGLVLGWLLLGGHAALLPGQYTVRVEALALIALGAVLLFNEHDVRLDVTSERLSSLSPYTVKLLRELEIERPVQIEAFISREVPEAYVETQLNLRSRLEELDARGGEKVRLRISYTDRFTEAAARAEKRYDITPREVTVMERETVSREFLFMGVAFTCGLEKVVIPFIDRGIPVEYELVRSLATVTQQKRRKVGVVDTDARLFGGFGADNWPIIEELEKQYEVERVDANSPITEDYDVLLAVQPSSLGPEQMDNFVDAVRSGTPTAIFEDPLPVWPNVPGTTQPRRPPGGMNPWMMGGRQPPMEKGNLFEMLDLLEVNFSDIPEPYSMGQRKEPRVVWQDYNPYPMLGSDFPEEFVFVGQGAGADEPFSERSAVTSGLQQMLFPFPGFMTKKNVSDLKFTALVRTGDRTGTVDSDDVFGFSLFGGELNRNRRHVPTGVSYVLAAHITGKVSAGTSSGPGDAGEGGDGDGEVEEASKLDESEPEAPPSESEEKPAQSELNVVLVADIDMLHRNFFRLREQGPMPEGGIHFDFDNVTFVLNVLDMLAGDDRFVEIRKRRPKHRTLTRIEQQTDEARKDTSRTVEDLREEYEKTKEKEDKTVEDYLKKLEERLKKQEVRLSATEIRNRVDTVRVDRDRRKQIKLEQLEQELKRNTDRIRTDLNLKIQGLQNTYKLWAVVLPPIPPLLVAVFVFFTRRVREREGVARSRLR